MTPLPRLEHRLAHTVSDALECLHEGAVPYAGATELIPAMRMGLLQPGRIVDVKHVDELSGIAVSDSGVRLGATTRHAELARHPELRQKLPMLARAAEGIGNPRVRWQGTLGGNLAFAEPRSDLFPVLIALGATVRILSIGGERAEPLESLLLGPFTLDRGEDELLADVTIADAPIGWQGYDRIRTAERPSAGVALVESDLTWRLVVGSAGLVPVALEAPDLVDLDADEVADAIDPLEDTTGSGDYKRHMVAMLTRRIVARAQRDRS